MPDLNTRTQLVTFGEKMRVLMSERGISVRGLARAVPCDAGLISKIRRDLERPSRRVAERLDEVLGAGGELLSLRWPAGHLTPDDAERLAQAARRPSRLDTRVIGSLATILAEWRRTEDVIGSGPLVKPVRSQLAAIEQLVTEARGPIRRAIVDVAAQWTQFSAWLSANTGRLDDAERHYDRAIIWATEAGNVDMVATAFNMKGHAAWLRGKFGLMISLSQAGQRPGASPGVRALSAQQEARGHAIVGDAVMTDHKLDEAQTLAITAAERPGGEPPWIYFFDPAVFAMQRARAYLYLPDKQATAAGLLTAAIDALPADVRRSEWVAFYLVDLARAYRSMHETGEAQKLAHEVAATAEQIGSKRLAKQAAALY